MFTIFFLNSVSRSISCLRLLGNMFLLTALVQLYPNGSALASPSATEPKQLMTEMAKHLECYPMELLKLKKHRPTIATEDLCLATIYHGTGGQPLWVTSDGPTNNGSIILHYLINATNEGIDPEIYKYKHLLDLWQKRTAAELAQLDTLLTYNLVKYVHDMSYGRLKPLDTDPELFAEAGEKDFDPLRTIEHLLATPDLDSYLAKLPPAHSHYTALRRTLDDYRQIASSGGWPTIPSGTTLHPGDKDERIVLIRRLLHRMSDFNGDSLESPIYSEELEPAVLAFQRRHGLEQDGIIGPKTLAAMNVPVQERIDTIRINMARWRWQAHDLGARYVLVNIAGYNLKAYDGETVALDFPVIVGKRQHQTPVFSDRIKYLDFNPFWNVTPSIARNEDLPKLRNNPNYLVERHIRLFSSWQSDAVELDSTRIDWHNVSRRQMSAYKLRQDPGPWNALGKVKFVFPNQYSVYMHDTPTQDLFNHTQRSFSHGCIRISDPLALAIFALKEQNDGWDDQAVMAMYQQDKRKVIRLTQPLPVHITYQTAWVDKDDIIHFNRDVYARDGKLFNALLKEDYLNNESKKRTTSDPSR